MKKTLSLKEDDLVEESPIEAIWNAARITGRRFFGTQPDIVNDVAQETVQRVLIKYSGELEKPIALGRAIARTICLDLIRLKKRVVSDSLENPERSDVSTAFCCHRYIAEKSDVLEQLPILIRIARNVFYSLPNDERRSYEIWVFQEELKNEPEPQNQRELRSRISSITKEIHNDPKNFAVLRYRARKRMIEGLNAKLRTWKLGNELFGSMLTADSIASSERGESRARIYQIIGSLVRMVLIKESNEFLQPMAENLCDAEVWGGERIDN